MTNTARGITIVCLAGMFIGAALGCQNESRSRAEDGGRSNPATRPAPKRIPATAPVTDTPPAATGPASKPAPTTATAPAAATAPITATARATTAAATKTAPVRVHVYVTGRVQGVSFRAYTHEHAEDLKLTGWVRNLPDKRVEAVIEGEPDAVEKLLEAIRKGSPISNVTDVEVIKEPHKGEFKTFEVTY